MKILLTGATGYIGRRLKEKLIADDTVQLRIFVRNASKVRDIVKDRLEICEGDTLKAESLNRALGGIDVAYYLVHSMGAKGDFKDLDRQSAQNFLEACIAAGVKRIIYLGGLGQKETASKHLLSRLETGEILSSQPDRIQTIWFRAGVIIGSGSASFEIIRHLVQKLPMMITPKWLHTKTQPISVRDVIEYLSAAKDVETKGSHVVDIGAEELNFRGMLLGAARVMDLKRRLIPVPFLTPRLSSYWLLLMTPVPYRVARALVDGLKSETVILNENAQHYFPEVILTLGKVHLCKYATPSTKDLPLSLDPFIDYSWAFLLQNHGALTLGKTLDDAYYKMEKLEHAAEIIFKAKQLGNPQELSFEDVCKLVELSEETYGITQDPRNVF